MPLIMRRQGDVLLVEVDELPSQLAPVPREDGRLVLAHGEATGHAHVLEGQAELLAADLEEMEHRFLRVEVESSLLHEEHDTIVVPPGSYRVVRQREYAPRRPASSGRSWLTVAD